MNEKSKNSSSNNNIITSEDNSALRTSFEDKIKFQNLDCLNISTLNNVYSKEDSFFKKNIEKINQKFYTETNKYLATKGELEKTHDNLFSLLFKQISLYIEEIEKLNFKLKEKDENVKLYKTKLDEAYKKELNERDISYYKNTIRNLEKKTQEKSQTEEKLKKELDSYKRQVNFYKEKLKIDYFNPIKKIELITNTGSNNNNSNINHIDKRQNPHELISPMKTNKNKINQKHQKNNLSYNFAPKNFIENEKKEVYFNLTRDNISVNPRNRISSMDSNNQTPIATTDNKDFTNNICCGIKDNSNHSDKLNIFKENSISYVSKSKKHKHKNLSEFLTPSSHKDKPDKSLNQMRNQQLNSNNPNKEKSLILPQKINSLNNKHLEEKFVQNNCQNIYNLNINPVGISKIYFNLDGIQKSQVSEISDIFHLMANNIDEELNLLKNEEIYLKILKEDLHGNENNESINKIPMETSLDCSLRSKDLDNSLNHQFLTDKNFNNSYFKKEISAEDLEDSDKINKDPCKTENPIVLFNDIDEKITNLSDKKYKKGCNFQLNSKTNKNKVIIQRLGNTQNYTPNKTNANTTNNAFSFTNNFSKSTVLNGVQNKNSKKKN